MLLDLWSQLVEETDEAPACLHAYSLIGTELAVAVVGVTTCYEALVVGEVTDYDATLGGDVTDYAAATSGEVTTYTADAGAATEYTVTAKEC